MNDTGLDVPYPRRQLIRTILRGGIAAGLAFLTDIQVEGRENLPKSGPLLVVGNHFHFLDPVLMIRVMPYPLEFIGGVGAPNAPRWSDRFRLAYGVLHVRRGSSSRDTLLSAMSVLKKNGVLGIYPEGGSWASVLRPPRPGAALLMAKTAAPILPVGVEGCETVLPSLKSGKRGRVRVKIGKPFGPITFSNENPRSQREQLTEMGHEIMRKISELISPPAQGFYSSDPAIREAARGTEIYPWEGLVEE